MFTVFKRVCIAAFFFWHAFAVVIYAIPLNAPDRFSKHVRSTLVPLVRTYMLRTGQWQQWELFSPNPLRRVEEYAIDTFEGDTWKRIAVLNHEEVPWYRDADELKLIGRLHENGREKILQEYLRIACRNRGVPPGTPVRMMQHFYVIPDRYPAISDPNWERRSTVSATIICS